jgi:hypothetical protein
METAQTPTTDEWIKKMQWIDIIEYDSVVKKNEIIIFRKMYGTGDHHFKQSKPGSERPRLCVFSHMWKIDPKDKYIHTQVQT